MWCSGMHIWTLLSILTIFGLVTVSHAAPPAGGYEGDMLTVYNDIITGREILEYFDHEVVLYAFCNEIKDGNQCWDQLIVAKKKFFENLKDDKDYNDKYHAVTYLIQTGNENQVRKLLADGTIFCHKQGKYSNPLKGMVGKGPHTPDNSLWKGLLEGDLERIREVLEAMAYRGLDKQRLTNTSDFQSPFYTDKVTSNCFDVTFRSVQDLMTKWTITRGETDVAISLMGVVSPTDALYNFYLGSLYFAYLLGHKDQLKDISSMVDCDSVSSDLKDECTKLVDYSNNPDDKNSPSKTSSSIPKMYYSSVAKYDKGDVKDSFFHFHLNKIDPTRYLETETSDDLRKRYAMAFAALAFVNRTAGDNRSNTVILS
ncbi:hypothetical protein IWQ62_001782 [Dispira parvispora]|uniref:Uncharacterized protein n=1 Tax=Dispira parvispora TaxID=1520584 RepID=A0A9W8ARS9_9FUNG|nr:hypothetical protein IWQ62_001782 [Dispira parvispora]